MSEYRFNPNGGLPPHVKAAVLCWPQSGTGSRLVHRHILKVSNYLRHYVNAEEAAQIIAERMPRRQKGGEIQEAIEVAYGRSPERIAAEQPPRHRPSVETIERIVAERSKGPSMLEELRERSPFSVPDDTEWTVRRLFEPDSLLCVAGQPQNAFTAPLSNLEAFQDYELIVPSPMSASYAIDHQGRRHLRCNANTGPRRYLVTDFDIKPLSRHGKATIYAELFKRWEVLGISPQDTQAALISFLQGLPGPLTMVVYSGNQSLQAWWLGFSSPRSSSAPTAPAGPNASSSECRTPCAKTQGASKALCISTLPPSNERTSTMPQESTAFGQTPREERANHVPPEDKPPRFAPGRSIAWYAAEPINHNNTLLGARYLCRGGGMFIVAPSGLGKSTLSIQMAVLWCCGLVAFRIRPSKALKILIVQSEDDEGDCSEMSQVMEHLGLSETQKRRVASNSELVRCNDLMGARFIEALRARLEEARQDGCPFDLVIINPYGSYLGADVKNTDACAQFLNSWLNPVLTEFDIAAIIIHHTPKTNFQNTDNYKIWDWMYWGAGCAHITNWARAILVVKPETDDMRVYRFIAAKRGLRIGEEWKGAFEHYFAWSTIPGVLRWEEALEPEIAKAKAAKSKRKTVNLELALAQVPVVDPEWKVNVRIKIQAACDVGEKRAKEALSALMIAEKIQEVPLPNPNGSRGYVGVMQK
jgi:hypothetical protein